MKRLSTSPVSKLVSGFSLRLERNSQERPLLEGEDLEPLSFPLKWLTNRRSQQKNALPDEGIDELANRRAMSTCRIVQELPTAIRNSADDIDPDQVRDVVVANQPQTPV